MSCHSLPLLEGKVMFNTGFLRVESINKVLEVMNENQLLENEK